LQQAGSLNKLLFFYLPHSLSGLNPAYVYIKDFHSAGVGAKWLCFGVLCLKIQIPSTKFQINFKFQYPTHGASACAAHDQNLKLQDIVWILEFWLLEFV
jgi:hypothetical protein